MNRCNEFMALDATQRHEAVLKAGRCLNCYSVAHVVQDCPAASKCRDCSGAGQRKHASALHGHYVKRQPAAQPVVDRTEAGETGAETEVSVRRTRTEAKRVALLRVVAVRLINPETGRSTRVYCQCDPGSQVTLVSEGLVRELELKTDKTAVVTLRTMAGRTTPRLGQTNVVLQSLHSGETFDINRAWVVPDWSDDAEVLPHRY